MMGWWPRLIATLFAGLLLIGQMGCGMGSKGFEVGWRCTAFDSRGREWYWHAARKSVAIDRAREACESDSPTGGCGVRAGDCMPL